ncbi:MAG: DNA gyrase inhibitor YacG [Planctomycetales bacterium]|nr:DNA gyrase inhibitor YacG [Planctomycetales bacterium]
MSTIRCPICEKQFDPALSQAMPFCTDRCRQIDLGRWLREIYSVPVERKDEDDEEAPEAPAEEER